MVCKQLYGLAYIPEEDVVKVFKLVQASCNTEPEKEVARYFGETYVAKPRGRSFVAPRYPPGTWNLNRTLYSGSPHTNNPVEGFHNKLCTLVNKDKSTVWDYIKCMKETERKNECEITRLTANQEFAEESYAAVTRKVKIKEKLERYNASNALQTLHAIAMVLDE